MTLTTDLVKMIQTDAIHDLWITYVFVSLLASCMISFVGYLIKDTTEGAKVKPFVMLAFLLFFVFLLTFFPLVYQDYRIWRDFPAQMILEKLM